MTDKQTHHTDSVGGSPLKCNVIGYDMSWRGSIRYVLQRGGNDVPAPTTLNHVVNWDYLILCVSHEMALVEFECSLQVINASIGPQLPGYLTS